MNPFFRNRRYLLLTTFFALLPLPLPLLPPPLLPPPSRNAGAPPLLPQATAAMANERPPSHASLRAIEKPPPRPHFATRYIAPETPRTSSPSVVRKIFGRLQKGPVVSRAERSEARHAGKRVARLRAAAVGGDVGGVSVRAERDRAAVGGRQVGPVGAVVQAVVLA